MKETAEETDLYEIPDTWDHMPSAKEFSRWMGFVPGIDYCWVLLKNMALAKRKGWSMIQLSGPDGLLGQVGPIEVNGLMVLLMCQGNALVGAAPTTAGIIFRIDPELERELETAKLEKETAPVPSAVAVPVRQKQSATAR